MMAIAALWIGVLLVGGGFALDRTLARMVESNFDDQLEYLLNAMIVTAEIGPDGEVYFNRPLGEPRFLEPNSGLYWQISGEGQVDTPSRSLWDTQLVLRADHVDTEPHFYNSDQFDNETLRIVERTVILPDSDTRWTFAVASAREELDFQISRIRSILIWSFAILALGLMTMAMLQSWYGLSPLRRVRAAIQSMRSQGSNRITEPLPLEVEPLVDEINALLAHTEKQAEEARMHAGNLAHALKTPLTVLTNAATARDPQLANLVFSETKTMQRHVEHHLARARAVGRRASGHARAEVWPSAESVLRAVTRIYEHTRFDLDGNRGAAVSIERQDLDEILGNLIENAAKYGGGSVFVTVDADPLDTECCTIWVEDDGTGIPESERTRIFDRGARLDTGKPGTGLGLAIVRDVAEIYGGEVELGESEDLGGLLVKLTLPRSG
ncbi:HAMP domain-containing histidine kinase [Qipengyuania sp. 6B39]|uniref:sensor histidine kinase n=1 Tax=Qipengyuania proteolytica TaxID=2867239 RepID=UPI001C89F851|nr:HAMP domain-containing sensor histidine kinase [Qipengyuania proteolytica]MBX7495682.1 HAMP domain-containing histidine kinase [Qipengyuania proteolytica]